jgi:DNA-nicking Smr family endonuclease
MFDPELLKSMMMGDYRAHGEKSDDRKSSASTKKSLQEIDLHAEKLFKDGLIPQEKLPAQIAALENYLEMASKKQVRNLMVIHGKGDSVLIKEVHRILKRHARVESFRHENDLPYLGGATRVVLK